MIMQNRNNKVARGLPTVETCFPSCIDCARFVMHILLAYIYKVCKKHTFLEETICATLCTTHNIMITSRLSGEIFKFPFYEERKPGLFEQQPFMCGAL